MTAQINDISELVIALQAVLPSLDVSVSIRGIDGVFLYVNDIWRRDFKIDPQGKRLDELNISSPEEITRSIAIDKAVLQRGSMVDLSTLVVNGKVNRLAIVRAAINFNGKRYLIVVTWILGMNYNVVSPFGWSSDRADRAFAEMIANRLQSLDKVVNDTLEAASMDLQDILAMVQAALDKEAK
jgi:hypothetical protein